MKFYFLFISVSICFNCFSQTHAQQVKELIEVKCYVELIGGEHTIHHAMISSFRLKRMRETLVGKKILLTTAAQRREVYKVHECTQANNEFKNIQAVALQKQLTY